MPFLLCMAMWFTFGWMTARLAEKRGRSFNTWFAIGALFGIFGVIAVLALRSLKKPMPQGAVEVILPQPQLEYQVENAWYYLNQEREPQGPLNLEELRQLWKKGQVERHSFVWSPGMTNWHTIDDLSSLWKTLRDL